ncbi:MAG: hypothetical protein HY429_03820 [Candidatus Levybacteria bacterium]|nr:hypothetical protein [Candidatus Levybacteria bacterium]
MSLFSGKKLLLLGFIVSLLVAVPLTVYFLQQEQKTQSRAAPATTLAFIPSSSQNNPLQKKVGDTFSLDIQVDPGANKNQVSFISLVIKYDATKLATASGSCSEALCPDTTTFPATLEGHIYTSGGITMTLSVGADPTSVVQEPKKVATVTFKGLAETGTTPTQVTFDSQTQVLSIAESDLPSENVLLPSGRTAAFIAIGAGPSPTAGPTTSAQAPTCDSLNVDRTTSGSAPFSITFTVNGSDAVGTIQKVTFDYGDGPLEDVTTGGGIGTNKVSLQKAHTFINAGTYKATAKLTNNANVVNAPNTKCEQTITVTGGAGGQTATPSATTVPTATPTEVPTPTEVAVQPTIEPTGPEDIVLGVGIAGIALVLIGAILLLAL